MQLRGKPSEGSHFSLVQEESQLSGLDGTMKFLLADLIDKLIHPQNLLRFVKCQIKAPTEKYVFSQEKKKKKATPSNLLRSIQFKKVEESWS